MHTTVTLRAGAAPSAPALVLRPWRGDDVPALVDAFRDPVLHRWAGPALTSPADAERWVRDQERNWAAGSRFGFAVLEVQPHVPEGELAGQVILKKDAGFASRSAQVGYWTAAHARGRAVAPRALEAVTEWAFGAWAPDVLERLELLHQVDNPASCRVADKSRYVLDGVLPPALPAFPREGHLHIRRRSPRTLPGPA
ncbi:GNAT family N-acetyltransferase [Streptomyces sp. NPDC058195]|uniref:GNAT family N-acetyltransferase n=1 Tax=Streptomyces sp. NPDC058195 TaxID=3346375 RepID=UPI0036E96A53